MFYEPDARMPAQRILEVVWIVGTGEQYTLVADKERESASLAVAKGFCQFRKFKRQPCVVADPAIWPRVKKGVELTGEGLVLYAQLKQSQQQAA